MLAELKNPALVIVDMQNDFVRVGAPMEVPAARASISTIRKLVAAFRAGAKPVVFTRYIADPFYRPLAGKLSWIKLLDAPTHACVPGFLRSYGDTNGLLDAAEVIDELTPLPGETVLDKIYFSAFHATDFKERLNRLEVDGLVFVGTLTEMCVEDSARHAVHYGFPTVLVEDAVSSNDPSSQRATLNGFARNYGWVMTANAVLETFGLEESATA